MLVDIGLLPWHARRFSFQSQQALHGSRLENWTATSPQASG